MASTIPLPFGPKSVQGRPVAGRGYLEAIAEIKGAERPLELQAVLRRGGRVQAHYRGTFWQG